MELPKIDQFIEIFGKRWDTRNVIPVSHYIDDIKEEEFKFTTTRYYLECHSTKESMVLDERNLIAVLEVAGGPITNELENL